MERRTMNEGQRVYEILYGHGEHPRSTAPEPSLIPHLAARLSHDFSLGGVLKAAHEFGIIGSTAPPWWPLWEATLWALAGRSEAVDRSSFDELVAREHWAVLDALRDNDEWMAEDLVRQRIDLGGPYSPVAGAAMLAPLLGPGALFDLVDDPAFDPVSLDPESARSMLAGANTHGIELPTVWIDAALHGSGPTSILLEVRQAHLLPELPLDRSRSIAESLAQWLVGSRLPPDMRALWVSRIAPFVSSPAVWDVAPLTDGLESVWREHILALIEMPASREPWVDVFRAHPAHDQFQQVIEPHETTADAAQDILSRWAARAAASAPDRSPDSISGEIRSRSIDTGDTGTPDIAALERSFDLGELIAATDAASDEEISGRAEPPPPDEPRKLQADVMLADSMKAVTAFVADTEHLVDVSIGRDAAIRADRDIEHELDTEFDRTDADWILLPVWFHAEGQLQSGSLRVPRDKSRNSTVASFRFVATSDERVLVRIHVMRPGGKLLLQSAILVGDIVSEVLEAENHDPGIQLQVDVVAGDLSDPLMASTGETIIADEKIALRQQNGTPIEVDVSLLQEDLAGIVKQIETAAARQDLDRAAVSGRLVNLAIVGQRLRAEFEAQLGTLVDANPLQIVSLRDSDVLPLELIYDGPSLSSHSEICPTWQRALQEGSCHHCAGGGPDGDSPPVRVCPMRFWSMSKVIERRAADVQDGRFRVMAERSTERPTLRPVGSVLVAGSGRVDEADIEGLRDFAVAQLNVSAETAANWAEWVDLVRTIHPELLIAMPHNQVAARGNSSALMVGEPADDAANAPVESELLAGGVSEEYVQLSDDRPGPIVLLLGCNTQYLEGRLSGFAGEFREKGAALTIGTIGQLRADHAPVAAQDLLERIVQPPANVTKVGELLLTARRQLLGNGMIMALLMVANGDAEWLVPETGASNQ
jgi:hypothetical protein